MENIFLLVLHELKDTLWLVEFLSKDISLVDTESTRLHKPVLSESIESFYNVKLTIGIPLLWYTDQVWVTTVCQVLKIALNPHPHPPHHYHHHQQQQQPPNHQLLDDAIRHEAPWKAALCIAPWKPALCISKLSSGQYVKLLPAQ